jgi:hypothetical protein
MVKWNCVMSLNTASLNKRNEVNTSHVQCVCGFESTEVIGFNIMKYGSKITVVCDNCKPLYERLGWQRVEPTKLKA